MLKITSVVTLILCLILFSSCGSTGGCKGKGGWYGDRNLTEVNPQKSDLSRLQETVSECE